MAPVMAISESEILDAIAQASSEHSGPDGARSVQEMAESFGLSPKRVRAALVVFQKQGRLVVHSGRRLSIDGKMRLTPLYEIRPAA